MRIAISLIFMLILGMFLGRMSHAHNGFENLPSPLGCLCCGGADCGPVEVRQRGNITEAHIVGPPWGEIDAWVVVPENVKLPAEQSPIAGPAACWLPFRGIICEWPGRDF